MISFPTMAVTLGTARVVDHLRTAIAGPIAQDADQARRENSSLIAGIAGAAIMAAVIIIYKEVK